MSALTNDFRAYCFATESASHHINPEAGLLLKAINLKAS
jgi:hypothetical protein